MIPLLTHWRTFKSESPLCECVYNEKVREVVISSSLAGGEGEKKKEKERTEGKDEISRGCTRPTGSEL